MGKGLLLVRGSSWSSMRVWFEGNERGEVTSQ